MSFCLLLYSDWVSFQPSFLSSAGSIFTLTDPSVFGSSIIFYAGVVDSSPDTVRLSLLSLYNQIIFSMIEATLQFACH